MARSFDWVVRSFDEVTARVTFSDVFSLVGAPNGDAERMQQGLPSVTHGADAAATGAREKKYAGHPMLVASLAVPTPPPTGGHPPRQTVDQRRSCRGGKREQPLPPEYPTG